MFKLVHASQTRQEEVYPVSRKWMVDSQKRGQNALRQN